MKHELSQLKLRMASASEEKLNAEEEAEASGSKAMQLLQSLEEMRKQIDESDEEHVLVELARIEAEKEYREIEARRAAEAAEFAERIQASKKTINDLNQEIARHAELQMELDVTNLVINELQKEVDSVRADGDKLGGNDAKEQEESSWHRSLLEAAIDELAKAKEVLASVKEEGFQFMNSMDRIREELVHIAGESSKLKKLEKKAESSSAQLKSKLLKAKTKLETMRTADERTTTIASNLSASILQLETEAQSAKKEKELISEENDSIKTEVAKLEMEISSAEEKLQAVAQVLRAAKASESVALKKLKKESKKATKTRAALIPFSSTMTISKSEYGYLRKEAAKAQMVADKKVAAARAWSEAVTDREKKALRKAELVEKEIREMRAVEVRELYETQRSVFARRSLEEEVNKIMRQNLEEEEEEEEDDDDDVERQTKSIREGRLQRSRSTKLRRRMPPSSPAAGNVRSPLIVIKKKRSVMPNLVKFLKDRRDKKQNGDLY